MAVVLLVSSFVNHLFQAVDYQLALSIDLDDSAGGIHGSLPNSAWKSLVPFLPGSLSVIYFRTKTAPLKIPDEYGNATVQLRHKKPFSPDVVAPKFHLALRDKNIFHSTVDLRDETRAVILDLLVHWQTQPWCWTHVTIRERYASSSRTIFVGVVVASGTFATSVQYVNSSTILADISLYLRFLTPNDTSYNFNNLCTEHETSF